MGTQISSNETNSIPARQSALKDFTAQRGPAPAAAALGAVPSPRCHVALWVSPLSRAFYS